MPSQVWRAGWFGTRDGYPPLILGQHLHTKVLVEIAASEPTWLSALPEAANTGRENVWRVVTRLAREGLVRRYERPAPGAPHNSKRQVWIDRRPPFEPELYDLLRVIGKANNLAWNKMRSDPTGLPPVIEDIDTAKQPHHLFGTRPRTTAIILLHLAQPLDARTIARVSNVDSRNSNAEQLLQPLVRERLVTTTMVGGLRLYRPNGELPWAAELEKLARRIAEIEPRYASIAAAAEEMRFAGNSSKRKFMRRTFKVDELSQER